METVSIPQLVPEEIILKIAKRRCTAQSGGDHSLMDTNWPVPGWPCHWCVATVASVLSNLESEGYTICEIALA